MKTWKMRTFGSAIFNPALIGFMAIIALGFGFVGCGGGGDDGPKDQTVTLTNLFGEGYSATVKGYLTDGEWDGVVGKIENALNGIFTTGPGGMKNRLRVVFEDSVTIIVEKTPSGYTKWKTSSDGKIMYLAFVALDNDLPGSITDAVAKMAAQEEGNG